MNDTTTRYRLVRPEREVVGPAARRAPAARGRPRGRPAARAGRPRHRQDDDAGRGDRRPHRAARAPRPTRCWRSPSPARPPSSCATGSPPASRRTTSAAACSTFHSFAYALVRKYAPAELYEGAIRLLSAPEADVVLRELLRDNPESVRLARAAAPSGRHPRASPARSRPCWPGPGRRGSTRPACAPSASSTTCPELVAAGLFLEQYLTVLDNLGATDYSDLIRRAVIEAETHRDELRARWQHVFVDEYQDTDPGQVALLRALAGDGRDLTVVGDPHQSIYGFRGADVRGILDFPASFPTAAGAPAPGRGAAAHPPVRSADPARAPAAWPAGSPSPAASTADGARGVPVARRPCPGRTATAASRSSPTTPSAPRPSGWPTCCAGPTSRTASRGTGWRSWCARGAPASRRCGAPWPRPASRSRSPSDDLPLVRDPAVLPLLDALRAVVNLDNDDPDSPDYLDPGPHRVAAPLAAGRARRLRPPRARCAGSARARRSEADPARPRARPASCSGSRSSSPASSTASRAPTSSGPLPSPRLLRGGARMLDERAGVEDVLWHLWSRHRRGPSGCGARSTTGGASARRAHRDLDAIVALFDAGLPRGGPARPRRRRRVLRQRRRPAAARRHARRAGRARRGGAAAHRPPVQGPRVGPRRRRPRAAGGLARPAPPHDPARRRPHRRRRRRAPRPRPAGHDPRAADGGAPAVLRRLHPRPAPPRGDRGAVARRRRRAALAVPRGARRHDRPPGRPAAAAAVAGRAGGRAASHGRRPRRVSRRSARPPPAGWPRSRPRRSAAASWCRPPTRRRGGAPAAPPAPSSRSATPTGRCRSRPACSSRSWSAPRSGSSSARPAASRAVHQSANLGQVLHALAERVAVGELPGRGRAADGRRSRRSGTGSPSARPWSQAARARPDPQGRGPLPPAGTSTTRASSSAPRSGSRASSSVDGGRSMLTGYADRLEIDDDGRVVVVDLKSARTAPTGPSVAAQPPARALPVRRRQRRPRRARPGGRCASRRRRAGAARHRRRLGRRRRAAASRPHADDGPERAVLRDGLARAADLVRAETFPAVAGAALPRLPVRRHLPGQGRGVRDRPVTEQTTAQPIARDRRRTSGA